MKTAPAHWLRRAPRHLAAAADCIAREISVAPGMEAWRSSLGYSYRRQRVARTIMGVLEYTEDGFWGER